MKNKIKIFFIYIIIYGCGFHLLTEHYNNSITQKTIAICFLPLVIFFAINIAKEIFKKNIYLKNILLFASSISLVLIVLYFSFLEICFFFGKIPKIESIEIQEPIYPTIETYKKELEDYSKIPFVVEHFPSSIPDNATDFLCKLRTSASYLTFKTDKNYIDQIINNNKNK